MNQLKKLRPLVQLIPAVAVAGIIAVTLPNTSPVLAEVPERLSAVVEPSSEAAAESEPEEEVLPALPYADGVYTGSSRGYGGQVKVQVTMENGFITDLQILDASHETSAFLKRAKRLLNIVMTEQTWDVDAVSEATYTSRGILGAIKNALTGEVVNNPMPPKQEVPEEPPVVEEFVAPSTYRDGIYTGTARGFGGDITVQVTITDDTITDISIVSAEGETRSYFTKARYVISAMLTVGTPEVDTISGATYSSTGIINAVKSALMKAANGPEQAAESLETPAEETPASSETPAEEPGSSETTEVMQPTIEVVKPEKKPTSFLDRAKELWGSLFPSKSEESSSSASSEPASSAAASEPEQVPESMPETADSTEPAESQPVTEPDADSVPAEETAASEPQSPESSEVPAESPAESQPSEQPKQQEDVE